MATADVGSEEMAEMVCQPCGEDGEHLPAEGYCTDCQEYLCVTCFTTHRRAKPCRHHTLLDKSQMRKIKPTSTTIDTCTEPCAQHKGEIIRFYCKSDDTLGCQTCVKIGHVGCHVSKLADISDGIANSPEYKETLNTLNGLEEKYDRTLRLSKTHVKEIETYHTKAIGEIEQIISVFRDEDMKSMNSISDTSNAVKAEIQSMKTKLEKLQQTNQNSQMFVEMRSARKQIHLLEGTLGKVESDNTIRRYTFTKMEQSKDVERNKNALGRLVMLPEHVADIDTSSIIITGSCLLSDNQLVIADCNNKKVKLVDIIQNKVTSEVQLTSCPWDVTMIDNSQVAVTVYGEKKIQFLSTTSSSLSKGREIKTNGQCMGLVHTDGTLIVTFQSPGKVEMMDMNGSVLISLNTDSNGAQLFDCPRYIAISPDKTAMYVSDYSKHTMTCMAMDGTVKAVYKDDNLKNPYGLAVDQTGTVYICDIGSNCVHLITAECTKMQILLGQEHGVTSPYSLTYSDREGKLYVGMSGNVFKVFHVK